MENSISTTSIIKKLSNKFLSLDATDKFGVIFGLTIFTPLMVILVLDIIENGARML